MAGGFYLIQSVTATSDVASVTFSNLGGTTYDHLYAISAVRSSRTGNAYDGDWTFIYFNGSTGTAYSDVNLVTAINTANGGNLIYDADSSYPSAKIGRATNATGSSLYRGISEYYIPDFRGTTYGKTIWCAGASAEDTLGDRIASSGGFWNNTAAITSVTFTVGSTYNIMTGSRIDLYGIKAS